MNYFLRLITLVMVVFSNFGCTMHIKDYREREGFHLLDHAQKPVSVEYNARVKNFPTKIVLFPQYQYKFEVNVTRAWKDHGIPATPHSGRKWNDVNPREKNKLASKFLTLLSKPFSYHPELGYMALIGKIKSERIKIGELAHNDVYFTPNEPGELILRVNEPCCSSYVYENNSGKLILTISTFTKH